MLRNITLSAVGDLIDSARRRAESQKTTLNEEFRRWLRAYTAGDVAARLDATLASLSYANAGRKFSRDEMNERLPNG
jgi:hypothetical protein